MHESRRWPTAAALWILIAITLTPAMADEADTSDVGAYILQAEMALQRNDYLMAAQEYRKAAELSDDPDVARQAVLIGMAYGFNREALTSAKRWHKLDKSSNEARVFLAQLSFRLGDLGLGRPGECRQADAIAGAAVFGFLAGPVRRRNHGAKGRRHRVRNRERIPLH